MVAEADLVDVAAKDVHKTCTIDCPEPAECSSSEKVSSTSTSSLSDSSFEVSSINGGV